MMGLRKYRYSSETGGTIHRRNSEFFRLLRNFGFPLSIVFLLVVCPSAVSEIPEPPTIIYGGLETSGGLEVTSGQLRFDFTPAAGGTTLQVQAMVGAFVEGVNYVAVVDMETPPLTAGASALETGSLYTPRVYYNGIMLLPTQLPSPVEATRAAVLGPYNYVVNPQGKVVSVSPGLDYGYVEIGSATDRQFTVSNVGTERVQGLASMGLGTQFRVLSFGVPVSEVGIGLDPGQSVNVGVRFVPAVVSTRLSDTFQVRTDGGDADRSVTGSSDPSALPPGPGDLNGDGTVDALDLIIFIRNWHQEMPTIPNPQANLEDDDKIDQMDLFHLMKLWE
jgi:hypothetical protein